MGDYYITENAVDPSEKWAGTSWERVRGRMLIGEDDSMAAGTTGGSATHTLTLDEMPSHNHEQTAHSHSITGGSHTQNINFADAGNNSAHQAIALGLKVGDHASFQIEAHTHDCSSNAGVIQNTGGGQSFSILNPYIAVYMWKRVA